MNKVLYYNQLFSQYKDLLTPKEQDIFAQYYEENLSMSEIAENKNISRSAVGRKVKNVEQKLEKYEKILKKQQITDKLLKIISQTDDNLVKLELRKIIEE